MPTITFMPFGKKFDVSAGTNLMAAIIQGELPIGSSCGGVGVCTKCLVTILEGAENLSPPNPIEQKLAKRENLQPGVRVSCQTKVLGSITITATYW